MLNGKPTGGDGHRPPPVTTSTPHASSSSADPAASPLALAQQALVQALEGLDDLALPALLCACVQGELLDFGWLQGVDASGHFAARVNELPPAAWRALDQLALARGQALTRVVLPPAVAGGDLAGVARGLGELPALRHLQAHLPPGQAAFRLDGARLARDPHTRQAGPVDVVLTLAGDLGELQDVRTPTNVKARAADREHDGPAPRSIKVQLVDDDGRVVGRRTLANLGYCRRTPELEAEARRQGASDDEAADVAQAMALTLNLNMQARFGRDDRKGEPLTATVDHGDPIVCRHLGAQWHTDRAAYLESRTDRKDRKDSKAGEAAGDGSARPRFSMAPMASVEAIAAHVDPQTEVEARAMWHGQRTQGLFSVQRFGQALAAECEAMVPGESRRFGVGTVNHFMSVELQVKEDHVDGRSHREYVVSFYDPNRTALPERRVVHDLADLENKPLSDWTGLAMEYAYFGPGPGRVGTLVRWGRDAPQAPVQDQVDADDRGCGSYLHVMMRQDQAAQVTAAVALLLAAGRADGAPRLQHLQGEAPDFPPVLHLAASLNAPAAAAAYIRAIAQAVPQDLALHEAAMLLGSRHRGRTALMAAALGLQGGAALRPMVEALLADHGLDSWTRMQLLLADDDDNPSPLLKRLADAHGGAHDAGQPGAHDRVYAYVRSVAEAHTLEPAHQQAVLASDGAARQALDSGNPAAAAAMLCAVLETGLPPETVKTQLGWLGVSAGEVVEALARHPGGSSPWARRLVEAAGIMAG